MPRNLRSRSLAPVLSLLALVLGVALAGAPTHPFAVLADAGNGLVVPQMVTNDATAGAAVRRVMDAYTATVDAGDLEGWLALWEPGGIQMPPGTPMRSGLRAIRAGMQPGLTQYNDEIHIYILEATVAGEFAYARGTYLLTTQPKPELADTIPPGGMIDGKFLTVLHRQPDGSWKIYRDIFNSNNPAR